MLRYRIAVRQPRPDPASRAWIFVVCKLVWFQDPPGMGKAVGGSLDKQCENYSMDLPLITEK